MKANYKNKKPEISFEENLVKLCTGAVLGATTFNWDDAKQLFIPIAAYIRYFQKEKTLSVPFEVIESDAKKFFDDITMNFSGDKNKSVIYIYIGGTKEHNLVIRTLPFCVSSKAVQGAFEYWISYPTNVGKPGQKSDIEDISLIEEINTPEEFLDNIENILNKVASGKALVVVKNTDNNLLNFSSIFAAYGELQLPKEEKDKSNLKHIVGKPYVSIRATTYSLFYSGLSDINDLDQTACLIDTYLINECSDETIEQFYKSLKK